MSSATNESNREISKSRGGDINRSFRMVTGELRTAQLVQFTSVLNAAVGVALKLSVDVAESRPTWRNGKMVTNCRLDGDGKDLSVYNEEILGRRLLRHPARSITRQCIIVITARAWVTCSLCCACRVYTESYTTHPNSACPYESRANPRAYAINREKCGSSISGGNEWTGMSFIRSAQGGSLNIASIA